MGRKNESLLRDFLNKDGREVAPKKENRLTGNRGRPRRMDREPGTKTRTLPGEVKYKVALKTDFIDRMKASAAGQDIPIKQAYNDAIELYLLLMGV